MRILAHYVRFRFSFISAVSDLSIVAAWQIGSGSTMSALGHEQPYNIVAILACERLLPSVNQTLNVAIPKYPILNVCFREKQTFRLASGYARIDSEIWHLGP